jgi:chemotaxis protein MotB
MSAKLNAKRPIVVRRRREEHEEHGGQWKVAYADFVTAMMAFFLIMWLLSVTNEKERASIAKYFTTPSIFDLPAGNGVLTGGKSVMGGADDKTQALVLPRPRTTDQAIKPRPEERQEEAARTRIERQRFEALKAEIERMMASGALKTLAENLQVEITPQGLRLQIFDRDGKAMFLTGSSQPTPRLAAILAIVAQVLGTVQNAVIITGHTDSQALNRPGFSNWELSADRANAARRDLQKDGLPAERFLMIEGRAATDPLLPASPLDPRNRRIAITVLRSDAATTLAGAPPPAGTSAQ